MSWKMNAIIERLMKRSGITFRPSCLPASVCWSPGFRSLPTAEATISQPSVPSPSSRNNGLYKWISSTPRVITTSPIHSSMSRDICWRWMAGKCCRANPSFSFPITKRCVNRRLRLASNTLPAKAAVSRIPISTNSLSGSGGISTRNGNRSIWRETKMPVSLCSKISTECIRINF